MMKKTASLFFLAEVIKIRLKKHSYGIFGKKIKYGRVIRGDALSQEQIFFT